MLAFYIYDPLIVLVLRQAPTFAYSVSPNMIFLNDEHGELRLESGYSYTV